MTYRGTVKNGVVVLEDGTALPEGAAVEVTAIGSAGSQAGALPGFGLWRDRQDLGEAADAARRLRRQVEQRADRG